MKSMMSKTTLREIRQSLGRYIAIYAIVALGVGFFAGLKVTKTVMVESANEYLQEHQLFDYRLLSTLGFEEEDVLALSRKEFVRAAEGAVEADILYVSEEGNEGVLKAHSLLKDINGLKILAGRMPETAAECVVDANRYGKEDLGSKITLSEDNAQEDLDNFTYREYTIVGLAQASAYIQFERGNTSLGNGRVDGFIYLLPEGFQTDYYTEIYVKFDMDERIFSSDYDAYMAERKTQWKQYCQEQGERRYLAVTAEAESELASAREELETEKADAEKELADGEREPAGGRSRDRRRGGAAGPGRSAIGGPQGPNSAGGKEAGGRKGSPGSAEGTAGQYGTGPGRAELFRSSLGPIHIRRAEWFCAGIFRPGSPPTELLTAASGGKTAADPGRGADHRRRGRSGSGQKQLAKAEAELEENRRTLTKAREELAQGREDYRRARGNLRSRSPRRNRKLRMPRQT